MKPTREAMRSCGSIVCYKPADNFVPPLPSPPPTPTFIGNIAEPRTLITSFFNVYAGHSSGMVQMGRLFSSEYTLRPEVLACAMQTTKDIYGPPRSQEISALQVSGNTATATVNVVSPGRTARVTFNLLKEVAGWKIARIMGWIGGDITPANPLGEAQSCLSPTPTR